MSGVAARGAPFMAPSVYDPSHDIHAAGMFERHSSLIKLEWVELLWYEEPAPLQESARDTWRKWDPNLV